MPQGPRDAKRGRESRHRQPRAAVTARVAPRRVITNSGRPFNLLEDPLTIRPRPSSPRRSRRGCQASKPMKLFEYAVHKTTLTATSHQRSGPTRRWPHLWSSEQTCVVKRVDREAVIDKLVASPALLGDRLRSLGPTRSVNARGPRGAARAVTCARARAEPRSRRSSRSARASGSSGSCRWWSVVVARGWP
jgi:hypothetical protein